MAPLPTGQRWWKRSHQLQSHQREGQTELWERGPYNTPLAVEHSLSPASPVIAVTVLLTGPLPAPLEAVTVMVYLLTSSRPGIVWLVAVIVVLFMSSSEQPTEVSLVHSIRFSVTTEPLGTLQERKTVVAVVESVVAFGCPGTARDTENNLNHRLKKLLDLPNPTAIAVTVSLARLFNVATMDMV